ncbi:hypothetical protein AWC38_SpisGene5862 [Stylophora pistillata]|uniref:Nucleolus and neural progenitor protein-like N-terminal domain-containing protein n=1 Tax=Stylophora pistillata TaxID=50429 RepID=A0A2B4SJA4_STYPI|nr:hypothetical protein AWC38_SpisGene5862 [Stylophora pistillata]
MAAVLTNTFWNRRGLYCSLRACSQENICKEKVDEDDIKDTISKLNSLVFKTKLLHLWSEAAIIRRVVYKDGNQHRKQLYFQGLRTIVKSLSRLQETEIYNKMINLRNTFPRLSKNGFFAKPPSTLPSFGSFVSILGCLVGAAQLTIQCYDVLFPWISLLENTMTEESPEAKDLPKSLKIWLLPLEGENSNKKLNSTCRTPQLRLSTSGALDKLFGSTPRGHLQDSSSRISEAIVDSLKEFPDDLGESCVLDEVTRSLKHRNASTVEKDFRPKMQLFVENPEELKRQFTAKLGPEKRGAEITDSKVSNTPIRIKDKKLEKPPHRAMLWRRSYSTTRIFGNKTWKLVIEMAKRRKLAKRGRKIKGNLKGSSKGAAREKEGRKMKLTNEHSKDGTVIEAKVKTKMLRKRRHGKNIKGNMKGSSKDTSRENEGSKMKKQEKDSGKDDTGIKADTKEEHIRDETFIEAKMKTKTVWKRRRGDKIRDGTFAKKRRIEALNDGVKESPNRSRKRKELKGKMQYKRLQGKIKTVKMKEIREEKTIKMKERRKSITVKMKDIRKTKKKQFSKGEVVVEKPRNEGHAIDSKRVEETVNFETSDHASEAEGNDNKTHGGNEALKCKLKKRKRKTGKDDTNSEEKTNQNATLGWRKRRRKGTVEHADYMNDIDEIFSVLNN